MKVLMAPVNIAGQPIQLVEALRNIDVEARLLQYAVGGAHAFGYKGDIFVDIKDGRQKVQFQTLRKYLEEDFDIYHFWLRSLYFAPSYHDFTGMDLPFIKARGKKIVYRFTGFDLRLKTEDLKKNPYSVFRYGYDHGFDETLQKKYISFLKEYVDCFVVQDPEMQDFFPEAKIIPRVMNIREWQYVGPVNRQNPLVVHAPSSKKVKGSKFVQNAITKLKKEKLNFEYKAISGMNNNEARKWYAKADIIIDQLMIGWYGVLTLEGMALGKPVVVYIREELLRTFEYDVPIQNANPDTIEDRLRELILDPRKREELGKQGRRFVEQYHNVNNVAKQLRELYSSVLKQKTKTPSSSADIDYFEHQLKLAKYYKNNPVQLLRSIIKNYLNTPNKLLRLCKRSWLCLRISILFPIYRRTLLPILDYIKKLK